MSLIRDAHYNSFAARICRDVGHRITGDRCGVCRIRIDREDISPHSVPRARGGVPAGWGASPERRDSQGRLLGSLPHAPVRADTDECRNGHTGRWFVDNDLKRRCRACRVDAQQRYLAKSRAA